ncbi:MAG: PAS domain S-box protein [Bacteroidales bacterium]|nr:PAS domain S-box protein [Bacteroidales bacterium]
MPQYNLNTNLKLKFTLLGFLIGIIFPLVAIIIEIKHQNLDIKFSSLGYIHSVNKVLFIVDFAPFVLAIIFNTLILYAQKIREELNANINNMNAVLQRNSDYAKRIGQGDLQTDIEVKENDLLGQSLLVMRNNLIETQQKEAKQTWITKGKELIGDILRFHNKIEDLSYETLVALVDYTNSVQGAFYIYDSDTQILRNLSNYAYNRRKYVNKEFKIGQGLIGAAAFEKDIIYRTEIPDNYVSITSGILGDKKPKSIIITPLLGDEKLQGIIEIASLENKLNDQTISLMKELSNIVGQTVFNLRVNERTEKLLQESRDMTYKLKRNEDELKRNAEQMKQTQIELEETNRKLAGQIAEVEKSRTRLYSLLENASEVISIYNEVGTITYESPSIKTILGYNPDELIGKNGFNVFNEDTNTKIKNAFDNLIENPNQPVSFEYVFVKKDEEEEIWIETIGRNLLNNPAINGIIFNTRDITVRKIAERAQRMSGRMQALSENSIDMIVRVNAEGKFFYANPIAEEFIRLGKRQLIGNIIDDVDLPITIKNVFTNNLNKLLQNPVKFETETTFPLADGEGERIVQFNTIPEFNELNELETILFVAHDITEQKQIQLEIEQKNKSITESINYARRIQTAILPTEAKIRQIIPKSFMFYLPRDVVSGDIPWIFSDDENTYIAAIDCTGHGVPGALLSFIGYFLLNNIVSKSGKTLNSGEILDNLHYEVRRTLKQDSPDAEARDGMDIALCKINFEKNTLDFSGAHRPLYYLTHQKEFVQYKGTLKAIGGIPMKNKTEKNFLNHVIEFKENDKIFFFSDGLADQIGGEKGRKYKNNQIRDLIVNNNDKSIFEFNSVLEENFYNWKGEYKQIDDIILIGVEF